MSGARLIAVALCALGASGCSEGDRAERTLDADVDRVSFATRGRLEIVVGDEPGLVLEAEDEDALDRLSIEVEGDRLVVKERDDATSWFSWMKKNEVEARVVVRSLEAVGFAGAGELDVSGVRGQGLAVQIAGRADCVIDGLAVEELTVEIAGAADCSVNGRAARQTLQIAGAGDYRGYGLETEFTEVEVAGAGGVQVNATDMLHVAVSGVGNVQYLGDPALHEDVAGWGSVERAEGP